jgi:hypothetical protein
MADRGARVHSGARDRADPSGNATFTSRSSLISSSTATFPSQRQSGGSCLGSPTRGERTNGYSLPFFCSAGLLVHSSISLSTATRAIW